MTSLDAPVNAAESYKVYPYRWVVMGAFMFVNLVIQMLWITYASVTNQAARYYGVSHLEIGLLAMIFMIVFIPLSLPAAWLIDVRGFRAGVGAGAVLMGVCGLLRGFAGRNYGEALAATIGIAAAQPFMLNAWTKVPARWFALTERATGVALATLAMLIGIAVGEGLTPVLIKSMSLGSVQILYGSLAMLSAVVFLALAREKPATPPCPPEMEVRALMFDGLRHAMKMKAFRIYLGIWFMGMGIFNGVLTWVDEIVHPRGFSSSVSGMVGALALIGGVLGSATLAPLSDKRHKRVRFMLSGLVLAIPGLVGLTFADSAWLLYVSAFAFGFFLISVGPIGMEYVAEITRPTPEGTSQGVLQLVGQCSVAIVYLMTAMKTGSGSYTPSLLLAVGLLVIGAILVSGLKDPLPSAMGEMGEHPAGSTTAPPSGVAGGLPVVRSGLGGVEGNGHVRRRRPMGRTRIVLGIVGVLLVGAAAVTRFAVYPAVTKLPSNTNKTYTYAGTATTLLNQAALAPGSTAPLFLTNLPLRITEKSRVTKANSSAAVVEYRVTTDVGSQSFPGYDVYYAIDRKTMEPSSAISASGLIPIRGLTISFPIGTQRHDYLGWVQDTGTAPPVQYVGTATGATVRTPSGSEPKSFGLEAYVFKQVVPQAPITDKQELAGLRSAIPKSEVEGVLGLLNLPPAEIGRIDAALAQLGPTVPLAYTFAGTYTFWVAPSDGQVLQIQASETRKVELPASLIGTPVPIATIAQFAYSDTPATYASVLNDAKNDTTALTLVGSVLPILGAVLGAALLVAAILLGLHRNRPTAQSRFGSAPVPVPEPAAGQGAPGAQGALGEQERGGAPVRSG